MEVATIVLAAGSSTRMGDKNKLLLDISGTKLICHVVEAALESNVETSIVVTGHDALAIQKTINNDQITFVHNDDYLRGLASSVVAGIASVPNSCTHAMILLGDMPGITSDMIDEMIRVIFISKPDSIGVATYKDKRGNPVIWPRKYFSKLLQLEGDKGARHLLSEFSCDVIEIELDKAVLLDIDTPSDLDTFK